MVLERCRLEGFALRGVAPVQPSRHADHYRQWLAAGKHGTMGFLAEALETRLNPGALLDGARSFVVVGDLYAHRPAAEEIAAGHGRIARYARGRDYHQVIKRRLHRVADAMRIALPGSDFRTCVDTAPVPERELAELAGLGWVGKNTMLINPRAGSFFFLAVMATNLELLDADWPRTGVPDHCGTCTRCMEACPTQALTPYSLDATRCISYLTIERREEVPGSLRGAMGSYLFGCDICQEVCPHNAPRAVGAAMSTRAEYSPRFRSLDLREVAVWTDEDRRRTLKGSPMKRADLATLRRSAEIGMANSGLRPEG